jgi:hypothetical protein
MKSPLKNTFAILLVFFTFSCSKNEEVPTPVPEIRENRIIKEINDKSTKTFQYDNAGQLIKITELGQVDSFGITQSITSYTYGFDGKVSVKTVELAGSSSAVFTYNYYYKLDGKLGYISVRRKLGAASFQDFADLVYDFTTTNVIKETDSFNQRATIISISNGNVTGTSYYANVSTINPNGNLNNTNLYSNYDNKKTPYDYFSLKTSYNFPFTSKNNEGRYESSNDTYQYNSDGYPISKKSSFDNKVTTYEYERL